MIARLAEAARAVGAAALRVVCPHRDVLFKPVSVVEPPEGRLENPEAGVVEMTVHCQTCGWAHAAPVRVWIGKRSALGLRRLGAA